MCCVAIYCGFLSLSVPPVSYDKVILRINEYLLLTQNRYSQTLFSIICSITLYQTESEIHRLSQLEYEMLFQAGYGDYL